MSIALDKQATASPPRRWFWRNLFFLTLVIGSVWLWSSRVPDRALEAQGRPAAPAVGHPAPDFTVRTLDGKEVRLSDLRGQAVLLNFWASWCGPCRWEMPTMQQVYEKWQGKGFTILAVNEGERAETALGFAQQMGLTFPIALDSDFAVGDLYQVRTLPKSVFIDRRGIIRSIVPGAMNGPMLESALRTILP